MIGVDYIGVTGVSESGWSGHKYAFFNLVFMAGLRDAIKPWAGAPLKKWSL